ncbi:MAG: hypothetical protein LBE62_03085 [Azonexus sp.]|jgi:hypothetical protein|nr:hypothetical protein [Azonexus sp.]
MDKDELLEAVYRFFYDRSRSLEETADGLEAVMCEIEMLLDALAADIRRQKG